MKESKKGQSRRLSIQQKLAGGPVGIFGNQAKRHDKNINEAVKIIQQSLEEYLPSFEFRHRNTITKKEINDKLQSVNKDLGKVLFVKNSSVKPDGGILEIKDKHGMYRVLLIGESKHQGNDIERIKSGIKQGKNEDADLMVAGNAIERMHKNIQEFRNYMIKENHFPYVVFAQGSNFAVETFHVKSPDGRDIKIAHDVGSINRIDRVTASSFGMAINKNYCRNRFVKLDGNTQMLQSASLYFKAESWTLKEMVDVLWEVTKTSFDVLGNDLEV